MVLSVEASVLAVARQFAVCWNAHDMSALGALFAQDADFVNVVGIRWKGRAAVQAAHQASHSSMFRSSRLAIGNTDIRLMSPSVAVSRSEWTPGRSYDSGRPSPSRAAWVPHARAGETR